MKKVIIAILCCVLCAGVIGLAVYGFSKDKKPASPKESNISSDSSFSGEEQSSKEDEEPEPQMFKFELASSGNTWMITGYEGESEVIVIPSVHEDKPVTGIADEAFADMSSLSKVELPDSITSIGKEAFRNCEALKDINIPEGVTEINGQAFKGCKELSHINLPDSLTVIGEAAFEDCEKLSTIEIPEKVSKIMDHTFNGCTGLTEVIINGSISGIGDCAFTNCPELNEIFVSGMPEEVSDNAFDDKESVKITLRHDYIEVERKEPTCTEDGYVKKKCKHCGEEITETLPAKGHKSNEGKTTKEPTCTEKGIREYTCTVCGEILRSEDIPELGHDYGEWIAEVPATETEPGTKGHYHCNRCDKDFDEDKQLLDSIVIPMKQSGSEGLEYYFAYEIGAYLCVGTGTCTDKVITIPAEYDGEPVVGVGYVYKHGSFTGNQTVETIIISEGTYMVNADFSGCSGLKDIIIPSGLISISLNFAEDADVVVNCEAPETFFEKAIEMGMMSEQWHGSATVNYGYNNIKSDEYDYFVANDKAFLTNYKGSKTEAEIPASIDGKKVAGITASTFAFNESMTKVVIPDSVTSIGVMAFMGCSELQSIVIGDSVTSIGSGAFWGCSGLQSIVIPDSVTSIGMQAFAWCNGLQSIVIPDSVTSIGVMAFMGCENLKYNVYDNANYLGNDKNPYCILISAIDRNIISCDINENTKIIDFLAFEGCSKLANIVIPGRVMSIGAAAFEGCSGLTSVSIPDSVTSIGVSAFGGCSGLTSVSIPDSVTSIGVSAFGGCGGLEDITVSENNTKYYGENNCLIKKETNELILGCKNSIIPDGVAGINSGAFAGCSGLQSIVFPDGVTSIDSSAFERCSGLTSIVIPDSVTDIGGRAFYNCSGLQSVVIGSGVTSIGWGAFCICSGLESIIVSENNTKYCSENNCLIKKETKELILGCKNSIIPDGVTSISSSAFADCSELTCIVIPDSVTSIGSGAFEGCSGLTSIVIPDSVTSIGDHAFDSCSGLTSVTIGSGVTSVGYDAFSSSFSNHGCYRLVEVCNKSELNITAGSEDYGYVGYYAKYVYTPDSGTSKLSTDENGYIIYTDGDDRILIEYTGNETDLVLPSGITEINQNAFRDCSGLTSVVISDNVTNIGEDAFEGCSGLTSVTIGSSVTSIGYNAFYDCYRLVEVCNKSELYIYDWDYGQIGYYVKNVYTPDSGTSKLSTDEDGYIIYTDGDDRILVEYAGDETDLVLPSGITGINENAFKECSRLTSIVIPDSVTSIGDDVFEGCSGLTSVVIPDSVTSIGDCAFRDCSGLTSVTIGSSVTSIGSGAFSGCANLKYNIYDNAKYLGNGQNPYFALVDVIGRNITTCDINENTKLISNSAFSYESRLTSIVIPDNVTNIGNYAFRGCSNLTKITLPFVINHMGDIFNSYSYQENDIPESLKEIVITSGDIGEDAFRGCNCLQNVVIGNDVTSIRSDAFSGCSGLTCVTIGKGVTSIGWDAFWGCSGLKEVHITDIVAWYNIKFDSYDSNPLNYAHNLYLNNELITDLVIPDSVTSIGNYAFYGCSGLTSVVIPDSVTSIGDCAFNSCSGLTSVTIGSGVTSIGSSAFYGCSGLTSVTIGSGVTSIGNEAFQYCSGLQSIVIGNGVTSIGCDAFYGCSGLQSVTIGNSVTSIDWYAFYNCSGLTSVVIPDNVTNIGNGAFYGCSGLESITVSENNTKYYSENNCLIEKETKELILGCNNSVIPDGVRSIGDNAFYGCSGLQSVVIPDSVTSIDNYAFAGCSGLESITVSENNTKYYSEKNCLIDKERKGLELGCKNSIIPDVVTSIYGGAFGGCSGLQSIVIPDNVTSIGERAFWDCSGLQSIVIPDNVTRIGDNAFYDCSGLKHVVIPDSVTSIGWGAFRGCSGLKEIVISDSVTSIGCDAFYGCSGLQSVVIPDSVTSIDNYAFAGCSGLKTIVIPDGVTNIGWRSFEDSGLEEVYYKADEAKWNDIAIDGGNDYLQDATLYYYSETKPTEEGNYWHYDESGNIAKWA